MSDLSMLAQLYMQKHPIECMFFSEFHHTQGPKITYQFPEGCITKENCLLEAVENYLIPKPELQQKIITVNAVGKKVIGCPVCIDNPNYPRYQYIFNFGIILDNKQRSSPCIPLIKKLSSYMTELEQESYFVSDEKTKALIPNILKQMFHELNASGICATPVNESTTIHLKIFPPCESPPEVNDYDVPILNICKGDYDIADWDLTSQQILPYIDGFRHVQKIAMIADVDLELARVCVQDMFVYNLLNLISIFQYTNSYTTTANLNKLKEETVLQDECVSYVARTGRQQPTVHDVITLFSCLSPDVKVRDMCIRFQNQITRVNEQKLIQFGLIHKLIRRIHVFPVIASLRSSHKMPAEMRRLMNGKHHTDDISCRLGIGTNELMARIEHDPNVIICRK